MVAGPPQLVDDDLQVEVGTELPELLAALQAGDGQVPAWAGVPGSVRRGQVGVGLAPDL